jgi:hypothetical protein
MIEPALNKAQRLVWTATSIFSPILLCERTSGRIAICAPSDGDKN